MNWLLELALGNALAATVLAGCVWLLCRWVRRPAVRHALWGLVLLRLLLPPIGPVTVPVRGLDGAEAPIVAVGDSESRAFAAMVGPARLAGPEVVSATSPAPSTPRLDESPEPGGIADDGELVADTVLPAADLPEPPAIAGESAPELPAPPAAVQEAAEERAAGLSPSSPTSAAGWPWQEILLAVWLAGALAVWGLAAVRASRFHRGLRRASPATEEMQARCDALAREMGLATPPQVWLVPGRVPPLVWTVWPWRVPARLLLPAALTERLSGGQLDAILAHELAHLARRDVWWRWLELVLVGLYWWYPLLGWVRRQLRACEEECCDARAVERLGSPRAYAEALVETVGFLSGPEPAPVPRLASGMGPVHHLKRRVTMIMRGTPSRRWTRLGLAAVLGLGLVSLSLRPVWAQEEGDKPRPRPERERERDRDRERKEDRDRGRAAGREEELAKARAELEKARAELREQTARVRELESRLARLEGRPRAGREGPPDPPRDITIGSSAEMSRLFELLSGGKDVIIRSELDERRQRMFDFMAQRLKLEGDRMTREQFKSALEKLRPDRGGLRGPGGLGGGFGRGGFGPGGDRPGPGGPQMIERLTELERSLDRLHQELAEMRKMMRERRGEGDRFPGGFRPGFGRPPIDRGPGPRRDVDRRDRPRGPRDDREEGAAPPPPPPPETPAPPAPPERPERERPERR